MKSLPFLAAREVLRTRPTSLELPLTPLRPLLFVLGLAALLSASPESARAEGTAAVDLAVRLEGNAVMDYVPAAVAPRFPFVSAKDRSLWLDLDSRGRLAVSVRVQADLVLGRIGLSL